MSQGLNTKKRERKEKIKELNNNDDDLEDDGISIFIGSKVEQKQLVLIKNVKNQFGLIGTMDKIKKKNRY